ncbi:MAG: 50S ribosomal protein L24 [Coxiellaceae bacterium]|nr:50S ribosomal protein L24 [Coxiellaceae bacterium]
MSIAKIRVGDEVVVIAGKDKGKTGRVTRLVHKEKKDTRLFVEGVNMVKKHTKPNPNKQEQGGIVEKEAALNISNVALLNPTTNKADRVGIRVLEDGKKVRYFKSNDEVVDV